MPSKKPVIAIRTEWEIIEKFKIVAETENRSMGNLAENLIKREINKYEAEHGEIKVDIMGGGKIKTILKIKIGTEPIRAMRKKIS